MQSSYRAALIRYTLLNVQNNYNRKASQFVTYGERVQEQTALVTIALRSSARVDRTVLRNAGVVNWDPFEQ